MSSENEREDRTDEDLEGDAPVEATDTSEASSAPEPGTPRNRAERRAVAKAARRGRQAVLADGEASSETDDSLDPNSNLVAPTTSMGGGPVALPEAPGPRRPRVPPRTMSKGTGDVDGVPDWARRIGETFAQKRQTVIGGALLVVVAFFAVYGVQTVRARKSAASSDALVQALDAFAAVPQSGEGAEPPRHGPTFASDEERLRETSTRFRRVGERHADARVAPLARLGLASTLYLQGRYDEARPIFQSLLGADLAGMEAQALEGLGFTLESQGDLDGALARFRELQAVQDGAFRDQAQFYQARVYVRKSEVERAKELLRQIVERIGRAAASDPTVTASLSLRDQAFSLLREVAPTDPIILQHDRENAVGRPEAHEGEGSNPTGLPAGLPPELLRQLQEQMRRTKRGG